MEIFALANEGLTVPKKEELTGKLKEIEKKSAIKKWIIAAIASIIISYLLILSIRSFFIHQDSQEKKQLQCCLLKI